MTLKVGVVGILNGKSLLRMSFTEFEIPSCTFVTPQEDMILGGESALTEKFYIPRAVVIGVWEVPIADIVRQDERVVPIPEFMAKRYGLVFSDSQVPVLRLAPLNTRTGETVHDPLVVYDYTASGRRGRYARTTQQVYNVLKESGHDLKLRQEGVPLLNRRFR